MGVDIQCNINHFSLLLETIYIKELLIILREIFTLRNQTVDENLLKDYAVYIHDIRRFMRRVYFKTLGEIQAYIDDYQAVLQYLKKVDSSVKLNTNIFTNYRSGGDSIPENNSGIDELYSFANERCSLLMEDSKYRNIILADGDRKITLSKGYFQGFYEALQMINTQMREKT